MAPCFEDRSQIWGIAVIEVDWLTKSLKSCKVRNESLSPPASKYVHDDVLSYEGLKDTCRIHVVAVWSQACDVKWHRVWSPVFDVFSACVQPRSRGAVIRGCPGGMWRGSLGQNKGGSYSSLPLTPSRPIMPT